MVHPPDSAMQTEHRQKRTLAEVSSPLRRAINEPAAETTSQKRRLMRPPRDSFTDVSKAQLHYDPEVVTNAVLIPERAYSILAEPQDDSTTYEQLEEYLWDYAETQDFPFFVTRHVLQQRRHLMAVRHLRTAQELFINRNIIEVNTGWRLTPLKPRAPAIRCTNVPAGLTNDEIFAAFFAQQNEDIRMHQDALKDLQVLRYRGDTLMLQVTPDIWQQLNHSKRLFMRHRMVTVEEHFHLLQCYKCAGYGHTAARCYAEDPTCIYCARAHEFSDCRYRAQRTSPTCSNCHNDPLFANQDTHMATDHSRCPAAKQRQQARKLQTIYDEKTFRALMHLWLLAGKADQSRPTSASSPANRSNVRPKAVDPRQRRSPKRSPFRRPRQSLAAAPPPAKFVPQRAPANDISTPKRRSPSPPKKAMPLASRAKKSAPLESIFASYRNSASASAAGDEQDESHSPDREAQSEASHLLDEDL